MGSKPLTTPEQKPLIKTISENNYISFQDPLGVEPQRMSTNLVNCECECTEKMHLKIEQELDKMRGDFRRKEVELFGPLLGRINSLEQRTSLEKDELRT